MINFSRYPVVKPSKSGYYYCRYFHVVDMRYYYKSIYYDTKDDEWLAWNQWYKPYVCEYIEETYNQHYVPSMMLAESMIDDERNK